MRDLILSFLLGMLPEIIYFSFYIICIKDIKEKRTKLTILIGISYLLCITISRYKLIYYLLFIICIYLILKILYREKTQIIDIFVISISMIYTTFLSYILVWFIKSDYSNYYLIFIINRVLLYIPFIFYKKFNTIYNSYCKLWNRNKLEQRKIKSITLRNISLIAVNTFIVSVNVFTILILSWK